MWRAGAHRSYPVLAKLGVGLGAVLVLGLVILSLGQPFRARQQATPGADPTVIVGALTDPCRGYRAWSDQHRDRLARLTTLATAAATPSADADAISAETRVLAQTVIGEATHEPLPPAVHPYAGVFLAWLQTLMELQRATAEGTPDAVPTLRAQLDQIGTELADAEDDLTAYCG